MKFKPERKALISLAATTMNLPLVGRILLNPTILQQKRQEVRLKKKVQIQLLQLKRQKSSLRMLLQQKMKLVTPPRKIPPVKTAQQKLLLQMSKAMSPLLTLQLDPVASRARSQQMSQRLRILLLPMRRAAKERLERQLRIAVLVPHQLQTKHRRVGEDSVLKTWRLSSKPLESSS